jgi:hypothetical protein
VTLHARPVRQFIVHEDRWAQLLIGPGALPYLLQIEPVRASVGAGNVPEVPTFTVLLDNSEGQVTRLVGGTVTSPAGTFPIVPPIGALLEVWGLVDNDNDAHEILVSGRVRTIDLGPVARFTVQS